MSLPKLEALLRDLAEHKIRAFAISADAKSLASDISNLCISEIDDRDLEYASSLLFSSDDSILRFLHGTFQTKDTIIRSAQGVLLKFIGSFIERARAAVQPYCQAITTCCFKLAEYASGLIRAHAIDVLSVIINPGRSNLNTDTANVKIAYIYDQFSRWYAMTKTPMGVKAHVLEFMGTVAQCHPDLVDNNKVSQLLRWCFVTLDQELFVEDAEGKSTSMAGALNGVKALLSSSFETINEGSDQAQQLFKVVRRLLDMPENLSRFDALIAALVLFSEHASIFGSLLIADCERLYGYLRNICGHVNRDIVKAGNRAMEALLKQVSQQLAEQPKGPEEIRAFRFFLRQFQRFADMDHSKMDFRDLSLSIRGIGYFSVAYTKYLKPDEIELLKNHLVNMSSWFYSDFNADRERFEGHLPSFIQAYTQFAKNIDTVSASLMTTIIKMVDSFMYNYARLNSIARPAGVYAIQGLVRVLYTKSEGTMRRFLSDLFYKALTYTCSNVRDEQNRQAYMDFVYFWEKMLCEKYDSRTKKEDEPWLGSRKARQRILYDEFFATFLKIIKAFNLDVRKVDKDEQVHSVSAGDDHGAGNEITTVFGLLQPVNATDFGLFHNMVQFWCILLPRLPNERLRDWFHISAGALIDLSMRRPLVSGFYRMLASMLSVASQHQFFQGHKELRAKQQQRKQLGVLCDLSEAQTDLYSAFMIIRDFLKEVWHRQQQFKDELLAACLHVVLSYPLAFFDVHELVPPLQAALKMGITFYPMATLAMDVLEKLVDPVDSPDTSNDLSYLGSIMPYIDEYLLADLRTKASTSQQPKQRQKIMSYTQRKRREIHFRPTAEILGAAETAEDVSLRDIQLRMMQFLGRIGGVNKLMVRAQMAGARGGSQAIETSQLQLVAWDPERKLKIGVPFPKTKVYLTFDNLLPRICELAESSPDRQVKVAACELLHTLVIYMIGDSALAPRKTHGGRSQYIRLYKRVFPVLLRLAVDIDQVPRKMFHELNAQLIHWLTNNAQYENEETMALLNACLDAVCQDDAGLQDYGAECTQEFVKWSIKQEGDKENSPLNIRSLLKRLYNMTSNPSAKQRQGACMVFNRIYRMFREEGTLVDNFTLELLYHLFFSLRLAEDDHPLIGTRDQAKAAISHMRRILRQKASIFQEATADRRTFPGLEKADLRSVVAWTFQQMGQHQREYAEQCMDFFSEFVRLLPGIKDGRQWLQKAIDKNPSFVTDILEPSRLGLSEFKKPGTALGWLRQVVCSLDGYVWIMERDMMDAKQIFEQKQSILLKTCVDLLENAPTDLLKAQGSDSSIEKTRAQSLYAYGLYQVVRMFTQAARSHDDADDIFAFFQDANLLMHPELIHLVAQMLLLPDQYVEAVQAEQSTLATRMSKEKVRRAAMENLKVMADVGPPRFLRRFAKEASAILHSDGIDLTNLQLNQNLNDMAQTVEGIKILQELQLFDLVCSETPKSSASSTTAMGYCSDLFDKFNEFRGIREPAWVQLLGSMLKIAFTQEGFASAHAGDLLLRTGNDSTERLTLYQNFEEYMNDCFAANFEVFAPLIIENISDGFIHSVLLGIAKHLQRGKVTRWNEVKSFMDYLVSNPKFLEHLINAWKDPVDLPDLITVFKSIFGADAGLLSRNKAQPIFSVCCQAFLRFLDSDVPLAIKLEAFDLLPVYICIQGDHLDNIRQALKDTVNRQFPTSSKDLSPNTEQYNTYISALDKLLTLMRQHESELIFQVLLPIFIQEEGHVHAEYIDEAISNFAKHLGRVRFESITSLCFGYFKDEGLDLLWRRNAVKLLISLLLLTPQNYLLEFYKTHLFDIMDIINRDLLRRGSDQELCIDLDEKYCAFRLMELHTLYKRVTGWVAHGKNSEIGLLYETKAGTIKEPGTKMTNDILTAFTKSRTPKDPREGPELLQSRRRYQQAAYNTISVAVNRTQKNPKVFARALFGNSATAPLWENIVDIDEAVDLQDKLDTKMTARELEDFRRKSGIRAPANKQTNAEYMESMQLSGSSLQEPSLSDMIMEANGGKSGGSSQAPSDDPMDIDSEQQEGGPGEDGTVPERLEVDQFNQNPCMDTLIQTVKRLHNFVAKPGPDTSVMPEWMNALHQAFTSPAVPLNVQLFIAKLIKNCSFAFIPYASHWIRPIIKLITKGDQFGAPINYFVHDLYIRVIVWGADVQFKNDLEDRVLLSDFMRYMMRNAYHKDAAVMKYHIQLIKEGFQLWAHFIVIPTDVILEQSIDKDGKGNQAGLQLAGMVLAHNLNPYYDGPEVDLNGLTEIEFYNRLASNLDHKHRNVVGDTAEVLAWAIQVKQSKGQSTDYLKQLLQERLSKMGNPNHKEGDTSRFLVCLNRIRLHHLEITDQYVNKVVFMLKQLFGDLKVVALQIFGSSVDTIDDVFSTLMGIGFLKMLKHRDVPSQSILLGILNKIAPTLSPGQVQQLLGTLSETFVQHSNTECRSMYYTFLQTVNDNLMDASPLRYSIKVCLLRGLTDPSEFIRGNVATYIKRMFELGDDIYERLRAVLRMYAPEVESIYVLFAIQMLLDGTKDAEDYNRPLFNKALPDARFDEQYQDIDTSWQQNASMTPLFAATQEMGPPRIRAPEQQGMVRATQAQFEFSLTQTVGKAYRTLTSTYAPESTYTESSQGPVSATPSLFGSQVLDTNPYKRLEKRMYTQSSDEAAQYFRQRHDRQQRSTLQAEKQKRQAEEKHVVLMRKYRMGELPDIQILYKDLIVPLQTLGRNDNETARLLYADLVVSITNQAPSSRDVYCKDILQSIRNNLEHSTEGFPPAIGSFLRICYDLDDTQLQSALVNSVSEKSHNQHIGIALLEKQEQLGVAAETSAKRQRTTTALQRLDRGKKHWIDLASLYRSVNEPETFQYLYQAYVAAYDLPKQAISAEIDGRFAEACNLFADAYDKYGSGEEQVDKEEAHWWIRERLNCFEQLTQWQDIAATVRADTGGDYDTIWDENDKDESMTYFIRSFTKMRQGWVDEDDNLNEWTADNPNPIYKFISSAMAVPERQDYLLRNYACDVSINTIVENQFDRARHYVRHAYDAFFSTWTTLHPLAHVSRMSQLAHLVRAVEMEDFLDIIPGFQQPSTDSDSKILKYLQGLLVRCPDARLDAMDVWDDLLDSRNVMIEKMERLAHQQKTIDTVRPILYECRKQFLLTMMAAARTQNNVNVAVTRFGLLEDLDIAGRERSLVALQNDIKIQESMVDERRKATKLAIMIGNIIKEEDQLNPSEDHYHEYQLTAAQVFELARLKLQEDPSAFQTIMASPNFRKSHEARNFKDATMMANYLTKSGFRYIQDAYNHSNENARLQAKCTWTLADYCDNVMRANDISSNTQVKIDPIQYSRIVIEGYFSSMDAGNEQAIARFPRLLELIERYPETGGVLKQKTEAFEPVWMYIRWIPQMVAILDTAAATHIFPALHKLAHSYPNALYYPFTISNEHYTAVADRLPAQNRHEIDKLAATIRSPLLEKFILELRRLGNPVLIAKDFIDLIQSYLSGQDMSLDSIKAAYDDLHELVLDRKNKDIGEVPKAFAIRHGSLFTEFLGASGSKLGKLSKADFKRLELRFRKVMEQEGNKSQSNLGSLKAHSPWLAGFHSTDFDEEIEIPGQYSGKAKPDLATHAKIVKFDERLLPMKSIRKPKRLQIDGSDENKHFFLIKEGEDLRLDQRIQQLYGVMNEILGKDPYCAKQGVHIRTYNVVPMTTSVGMIEWVNDTVPLVNCVAEGEYKSTFAKVRTKYASFYVRGNERRERLYLGSVKTSRDIVVNRFEKLCKELKSNTLRKYLLRMASSPEAFLYIRKDFINSLAAISISGYILGIGDRHLENFLVDSKSGQMIPIDFGHAFGSATELLQIPELMPFRLTQCFTGTLEPLGLGMLELVMTHILQSLHQHRDTLLNVMDVFIKEPLLDWRKQALNEMSAQRTADRGSSGSNNVSTRTASGGNNHPTTSNSGGSNGGGSGRSGSGGTPPSTDDEIVWFPQQKLDAARRKLHLENPGYTMAASVSRNRTVKALRLTNEWGALAKGDPKHNYRATIDEKCPSVKEQVKCLIDLATDPAVLGRTWAGWTPVQ